MSMAQDRDGLMTVEEFNRAVNKWASKISLRSRQTLRTSTHGSGTLANSLMRYVDSLSADKPAYKVAFRFDKYGIYRAYGAGRGYVVMNGQITRGRRTIVSKEVRERFWNVTKRKMGTRRVTKSVFSGKEAASEQGIIRRSPLNWIDYHIQGDVAHLADVVQEYYGDMAVKQVLQDLDKLKIIKKK